MLVCSAVLAGCAAKPETGPAPLIALETDGPKLAIAGEYSGMILKGEMDRTCMAGYGGITLEAVEGDFVCTADIDDPPTEKGRVRGALRCSQGRTVLFTLRNTGPDQGVGIGMEQADGAYMVVFYHPSREEAERRLPRVMADIEKARQAKKGE